MPFQIAFEQRILSAAEFRAVKASHLPDIKAKTPAQLAQAIKAIRLYHDKARDLSHQHKRAKRGKPGATAAKSADGAERAAKKLAVLSQALGRVTARLAALETKAKQARTTATLKEALARKKASAGANRPGAGRSPGKGMAKTPSGKRRTKINPGRIGSVSQQGKRAQARRDAR
jgi:hypothetical protein